MKIFLNKISNKKTELRYCNFLLSFLISGFLFSQQIYVPDNNFEQALIDLGYDNVLDDYVSTNNIGGITSLNLYNKGISDLTGIEGFINLLNLNCSFNNLEVLDLSKNSALKVLSCAFNQLKGIDLSDNNRLTSIDCGFNYVTSLDLSNNMDLTVLYVDYNNLNSLNIKNGNNSNIVNFSAISNPGLTCVQVDNIQYSQSNWNKIDAGTSFSSNCDGVPVEIELTYVPDDNFEQALIDLGYDDVLDDYVATSNISAATSLNLYNKGITDLTGIEGFTSLTTLNCVYNRLTSLDLSNNLSLQVLSCYLNNLTSLDLSNNVALTTISCANNNLESLNVKNGNNLKITNFRVVNNPNLTCIEVDNALYSESNWTNKDVQTGFSEDCSAPVPVAQTYVPDDNFEQALIDLGYDDVLDDYVATNDLTGITTLDVSNRGISDLTGIEDFIGLESLNCSTNRLNNLDVSNNTKLNYLYCLDNNIASLDLSNNLVLQELSCNLNTLNSLDLSNNQLLQVLSCNLNNLTSLDLSNNVALTSISCTYNYLESLNVKNGNNLEITNFRVGNNPNLTCIEVDNALYSESNWTNKDAQAGFSEDCSAPAPIAQTYVPDDNFEQALIDLGYDDVLDDYVATSNISAATSLNLYNKGITDLTGIEGFTSLTTLNCVYNRLTSLDLSNNLSLQVLSCYLNNLTSLDLSNNVALTTISCSNNNLESLTVKNGNNLKITNFRVANNPNLTCIEVDNALYSESNWTNKDVQTGFSEDCSAPVPVAQTYVPDDNFEQALIDLGYDDVLDDYVATSNISAATSLNLYNKGITDLTGIEGFTSLTTLNCVYNRLTSLDLSNNLSLQVLSCYLNNLTSLDLSNNVALTTISCSNNNLESLNVKNGNNLKITNFRVANNPNLTCIEVDNALYSEINWTNKDAQTGFSENCDLVQNRVATSKAILGVKQTDKTGYRIFPNPVRNILNIILNDDTVLTQVNFYDMTGKLLFSSNQKLIDVSQMLKGFYLLEVKTNLGVNIEKIIVK
ncbi:T9SS type A sorting domain-containing protein [Flavobacteriaceae bacterium SZ-1-7]|uniref:T9SS type A sorting domain-containing protein n=1 Tax=Tamlana sedimenti TaxID=3134126 RepID=UPI003127C995